MTTDERSPFLTGMKCVNILLSRGGDGLPRYSKNKSVALHTIFSEHFLQLEIKEKCMRRRSEMEIAMLYCLLN